MQKLTNEIIVKICQTEDELNQVIQMTKNSMKKSEALTNQEKQKGVLHPLTTDEYLKTTQKLQVLFIAKHKNQVVSYVIFRKLKDLWQYSDFQYRSTFFNLIKESGIKGKQAIMDGDNVLVGPGVTLQEWRKSGVMIFLAKFAIQNFKKSNLKLIGMIDIDNYASLNYTISTNWKICGRFANNYFMIKSLVHPKL